jgi:hypothetical protein
MPQSRHGCHIDTYLPVVLENAAYFAYPPVLVSILAERNRWSLPPSLGSIINYGRIYSPSPNLQPHF